MFVLDGGYGVEGPVRVCSMLHLIQTISKSPGGPMVLLIHFLGTSIIHGVP